MIISRSADDTLAAGRELASMLVPGTVLALTGDLGAGKTHFVKGLAEGLGASGPVTSPTFTLIHEYPGPLPLFHVDLYRLDTPAEAVGIGLDEYLDGYGVTAVEWADKFPELVPARAIWVRFTLREGNTREIRIEPPTDLPR